MDSDSPLELLEEHYTRAWGGHFSRERWPSSAQRLGPEFQVLVFPPGPEREYWVYATAGMGARREAGKKHRLELHLVSPVETPLHVELLTVVAHYHLTGRPLGWGHTVDFGRPWLPGSSCAYGLVSLPYLDGPKLEWCRTRDLVVRCLWLLPITKAERELKRDQGIEALESRLEAAQFNYLDPFRPSVADVPAPLAPAEGS